MMILSVFVLSMAATVFSQNQYFPLLATGDGFTWEEAKAACSARGMIMATFETYQDGMNAIDKKAEVKSTSGMWVGLHKGVGERWANVNDQDGNAIMCSSAPNGQCDKLMFWSVNEPSNSGTSGEACGMLWNGVGSYGYEGSNADHAYGVLGMLNDATCSLRDFHGPMGVLCMDRFVSQSRSEPVYIPEMPEENFYPAPANSGDYVLSFTSSDLLIIALLVANIVTVAISAYLCCSKKQSASIKYNAVDMVDTTDEELA